MVEKFYYSMGEITEMFDVEPSVIRYWCKQFSCLNPKRNAKGNRLFTAQDVERLKRIYHLLKEKRMTIEGAQKAMRKKNFVVEGDDADVKLLEQLQLLRAMLVEMRDSLGEPLPMEEIVVAEPTSEPVSEPVSEPEESDADAVPQVEPVMPANAYRNQKVLVWVLVAAVALLLIILFILLFKEQFAQMLRNLLYTEEELEIIRQWGAR
jgi:DNA-binding transcriptional MerR regulator